MYWRYLKYVIEHKKNVFIECIKSGQIIHAFTHDLSKFLPSEFVPYARHFQGPGDRNGFEYAWLLHQNRNKHHWNYWVNSSGDALPMPRKYVWQMIADWKGMSRKFGDTAVEFYHKNRENMNLHKDTRELVEIILALW